MGEDGGGVKGLPVDGPPLKATAPPQWEEPSPPQVMDHSILHLYTQDELVDMSIGFGRSRQNLGLHGFCNLPYGGGEIVMLGPEMG